LQYQHDKFAAYYDDAPKLPNEEPSPGAGVGTMQSLEGVGSALGAMSPDTSVPWQSIDQHTTQNEKQEEPRICGIRRRIFIILSVVVVLIIVAVGVGAGIGASRARGGEESESDGADSDSSRLVRIAHPNAIANSDMQCDRRADIDLGTYLDNNLHRACGDSRVSQQPIHWSWSGLSGMGGLQFHGEKHAYLERGGLPRPRDPHRQLYLDAQRNRLLHYHVLQQNP
jgi:hypothetical protein